MLSKKVILIGNFGVGKTSLTERFVHKRFSDEYLTTLGVRIDKKEVVVAHTKINLVIWDIAGEVTQKKVNKSYYLGASGVIYVFDLTRPVTYASITAEISYVKETLPQAKVVLVGNKLDLVEEAPTVEAPFHYHLTSAKTGESVEAVFQDLATKLI